MKKRYINNLIVFSLLISLLIISLCLLCSCDLSKNQNNQNNTIIENNTNTGDNGNNGSNTDIGDETGNETDNGFIVSYSVDRNVGGKIVGKRSQTINWGDDAETVVAVADEDYIFVGWSDLSFEAARQDKEIERNFEYVAYFQPISKIFRYDYGELYSGSKHGSVTLNRDNLDHVEFDVPQMNGYVFLGWYADKNFRVKITDENGRLMLGFYTFDLDTEVIYARWKQNGMDEKPIYRVLTVFVDEVEAQLQPTYNLDEPYISVSYKMSVIEQRLFALITTGVCDYLNNLFDGEVKFEFDNYYTTRPINENSFESGNNSGLRTYSLQANRINEVQGLLENYRSVMTLFSMNDWDRVLHNVGGSSTAKYGMSHIEEELMGYIINYEPLQDVFNDLKKDRNDIKWLQSLDSYLHEFIHTIEQKYYFDEIYEYHEALDYYLNKGGYGTLDISALYLLNQAEINGKFVGIPKSYWEDGDPHM